MSFGCRTYPTCEPVGQSWARRRSKWNWDKITNKKWKVLVCPSLQKNMTDRMSDSIRERQSGQYCHNSSQLSQKFLIDDNYHKISQLLIIVTIGHNCHNFSQLSKLSHLSQLPCQNCHLSNWSVSKIGQNSYYWSQLLQLFAIVHNSTVTIIVCHYW